MKLHEMWEAAFAITWDSIQHINTLSRINYAIRRSPESNQCVDVQWGGDRDGNTFRPEEEYSTYCFSWWWNYCALEIQYRGAVRQQFPPYAELWSRLGCTDPMFCSTHPAHDYHKEEPIPV